VLGARARLASLWLSQVTRVLGDWCLRVTALLAWSHSAGPAGEAAWHVATTVFIAPFILLAPLNGCISNGLPRRWVLAGASAWALLAVALFAAGHGSWMTCLGVLALGSAVYSPARYAMLPAAAADTHLPLPRVNGLIEMGGAAAIVGGVALGWSVGADGGPLAQYAVPMMLALNLLSVLTALPASFPSDVRRPEAPVRAVAGFFRDSLRVARTPAAAGAVLGLACFQALVTAGSGAIVTQTTGGDVHAGLLPALVLVGAGAGLGCLTAGLQGHPLRSLGLIPLGATGLLLALAWATTSLHGLTGHAPLPLAPCLLLGFMGGLVNVPLRAAYMAAVPADARGNAMAVMNFVIYVLTINLALLLVGLIGGGLLTSPAAQLAFLAVLAAAGAAGAWWRLLPEAVEAVGEVLLALPYRVYTHGPGRDLIPRTGPLLIVANHSAYLDPIWLFKIMPRRLTPLMTSVFYDKRGIHWAMVHIVGAIRVQQTRYRREAPELRQAVAVLRRGGAVLLFPEAKLRRRADQTLRLFGRGVWHILREMPETPVVVCWIEGGWGSFTSYDKGPPLRNKRPDWARRIDIAVERPQVLDPAVLADQQATRLYLMRACLACRRYLGLSVPPPFADCPSRARSAAE
jgi:1-acyl-sn-glycerol-3-phosphate acyltransferase